RYVLAIAHATAGDCRRSGIAGRPVHGVAAHAAPASARGRPAAHGHDLVDAALIPAPRVCVVAAVREAGVRADRVRAALGIAALLQGRAHRAHIMATSGHGPAARVAHGPDHVDAILGPLHAAAGGREPADLCNAGVTIVLEGVSAQALAVGAVRREDLAAALVHLAIGPRFAGLVRSRLE